MDRTVGVIGLGYVGLPLAIEIGKKIKVKGFDTNSSRVSDLSKAFDRGTQISEEEFLSSKNLVFSSDETVLKDCDIYIVCVPTPVNENNSPNLSFLESASKTVSKYLSNGNLVIFESTVYPGATEEFCIPILEKNSGLSSEKDFGVGYSPERINPGDPSTKLSEVTKVISAGSNKSLKEMRLIYRDILGLTIFEAANIKTAEASKALENTQRDVNIALMNESSILFKNLGINFEDVLNAAETKWNFHRYNPGLVGGHCIRVDPYYLIDAARKKNIDLKVVESAREVNEGMVDHIVNEVKNLFFEKKLEISQSKILVLGATYKEDFPDTRSSLVFDIIKELSTLNILVDVYEPILSTNDKEKINLNFLEELPSKKNYDGIILAVAHSEFKTMSNKALQDQIKDSGFIFDVKCILPKEIIDNSL